MMQTFKTLSDAIALAEFAHRSQVDKAGLPYIEHPRRVLAKVQAQGAMPYVQIAAILHDVTEDTRFTPQMLLDLGFSEAAVNVISLLDRGHSQAMWERAGVRHIIDCDEYYYQKIKENPGAFLVKAADIEDNLSPWRLAYLTDETKKRLGLKYNKAKQLLGIPLEAW
jgi:(p)ppGpp synthase/HD superfamily hydrolase